ncbi:CPBP family intramembrane glutamic endopeptidase [Clostridium brassicae]|uniref:Type II CAAX endopeptidase family protein n=1 Tax=Clostridium brassicae TaxID=2999072 RepID=A0ABT4D7V8_9CLOT|nr:type II CAAX endopeptidase family protein [Clostridium brassicae]MCY6958387.1 type II CAAX endopeptidase family protein [Clostridium brassicae]
MKNKELKEVTIFFLTTIFLSLFVFWGPIALFKVPTMGFSRGAIGPVWAIILFVIGGFAPSITGIILTAVFEGKKQTKQLLKKAFQIRIGFKWFAAISLTAVYFVVSWSIIYLALDGDFNYSKILTILPTILPLFILGPLSEEYGWRGFALKRLLKIVSPNIASLAIGLVWSLWHLPLFYIVGTNQYEHNLSFFTFVISVTSSSFIYTYFYIKTNQNLFTAVFFHWVYTFLSDVVHGGIVKSNLFNSLEFVPVLIIGLVFAFVLHKVQPIANNSNVSSTIEENVC